MSYSMALFNRCVDRFFPDMMPGWPYRDAHNDNKKDVMTGNLAADQMALKERWGLSDAAFEAWLRAMPHFGMSAMTVAMQDGQALLAHETMTPDAIITAAAMAFCGSMFAYIKTLPQTEAVFVLEEIARQTESTIQFMKTQGK